ncbi:hypothetical protein F5B19DRAFT_489375 [Rostrohypoxylon terebratum]|nr:hypothetical protein F5B19DRAFT_489375 [Rostrohypoxylon terebratum]
MCRRVFTHYMHHDVRAPMIIDPYVEKAFFYANPRYTPHHKCELCHIPPEAWLVDSLTPKCEHHSCCILVSEVEFCADFYALGNDKELGRLFQPEMCIEFTVDHRHRKLSYFGHPELYPRNMCPSTWRKDLLEVGNEHRSLYAEEEFFKECEKLYTLEQDAKTQFLVYRDLRRVWPKGSDVMQHAQFNVEQSQTLLTEQKQRISEMLNWQRGIQGAPVQFIPIWWMRMWALENGAYEE